MLTTTLSKAYNKDMREIVSLGHDYKVSYYQIVDKRWSYIEGIVALS